VGEAAEVGDNAELVDAERAPGGGDLRCDLLGRADVGDAVGEGLLEGGRGHVLGVGVTGVLQPVRRQ
jgi:hypothetical protein